MPDLQPLLVEAPQLPQTSAIWPGSTFTPGLTSFQVLTTIQASRSPTSVPVQTLAPTRVSTSARSRTPAMNSSPSSLLLVSFSLYHFEPLINLYSGISNMEIDKIVANVLDRYLSNQRPGMRGTRVNTSGSYEESSTIEFHNMGSPIAPWFAVTRGRCPGTYHNL
jgi:hypothetical protein